MTTWKNIGLVFNHKHMLYLPPLTSIHLKGWGVGGWVGGGRTTYQSHNVGS